MGYASLCRPRTIARVLLPPSLLRNASNFASSLSLCEAMTSLFDMLIRAVAAQVRA